MLIFFGLSCKVMSSFQKRKRDVHLLSSWHDEINGNIGSSDVGGSAFLYPPKRPQYSRPIHENGAGSIVLLHYPPPSPGSNLVVAPFFADGDGGCITECPGPHKTEIGVGCRAQQRQPSRHGGCYAHGGTVTSTERRPIERRLRNMRNV